MHTTVSLPRRRGPRLTAALAALLAVIALVAAGCGGDSSTTDSGSAAGDVAAFVPAGSPVYFEVSTDLDGPQWRQVVELAQKFPDYPQLERQIQESLAQEGVDFERDVKPLLGDRAAVAVLRAPEAGGSITTPGGAAGALGDSGFVAAVALAEGKEDAVRVLLVANGAERRDSNGVEIYVDGDSYSTVADNTLVVADSEQDLAAALEAKDAGGDRTLAGDERFTGALGNLPGDTFAQLYVDLGGFLDSATAAAGDNPQLGALGLDQYREAALAASLSAEPEGMRLKGVVTNLPEEATVATEFTPALTANVPADALAYIGLADLAGQAERAIAQVRAAGGDDVSRQIDAVGSMLPQLLGVSVDDLAALARGEHALVVTQGAPTPGVGAILRVEDGARAQATLDGVRENLPQALSALGASGAELPPWQPVPLAGGVQGWQLPLSPEAGVVYGVQDRLAIIGSTPATVQLLQAPVSPLSGSDDYTAGTRGIPDLVTGVLWVNLAQTVTALQSAGQLDRTDPRVLANLRPLRSIGAWSTGGTTPTFEVFLRLV